MFVPDRRLAVGDDARTRNRSACQANRNVRVAGDYIAVVMVVFLGGEGVAAGFERGEETTNALGYQVHIGKTSSFEDGEIKITMEIY